MMQKYNKGDHVQVAKDLGQSMSHFQNDCEAIIIASYDDQYGGGNTDSYTIHVKGGGQTSWYYEHQLELIEANRLDLLEQWEIAAKNEADIKSDLDWIFSHGKEVLEGAHSATVAALAECFGLTNLWGARGEGIDYYANTMTTLVWQDLFLKLRIKTAG